MHPSATVCRCCSWKQYGRKKITGWKHRRTYYQCKVAGCPATRRTQLTNDGKRTAVWYVRGHRHSTRPRSSGTSGHSSVMHAELLASPTSVAAANTDAPLPPAEATAAVAVCHAETVHDSVAHDSVAVPAGVPTAAWTSHSLYYAAQSVAWEAPLPVHRCGGLDGPASTAHNLADPCRGRLEINAAVEGGVMVDVDDGWSPEVLDCGDAREVPAVLSSGLCGLTLLADAATLSAAAE